MEDATHQFFPPIKTLSLLFLWVNTGCNARCGMCSIWLDHSKKRITAEEIREWVSTFTKLRIREVQLCGESTIHPQLSEICEHLHNANIEVHLLSNGLMLEEALGAVNGKLASITVSLDGPQYIHDRIRGVDNAYLRLQMGLSSVHEQMPDIPINGRCVVHRLNFRALPQIVDVAHELGLSSISFLGIDTNSDAFGRDRVDLPTGGYVPQEFLLRMEDLEILKKELDALSVSHRADFNSGFIVESEQLLQGILLGYYSALFGRGNYKPREPLCNAPWTSAVIEPDGVVRPCFFLPAYGNIRNVISLDEIINSYSSRRFRATLAEKGHTICEQCICPRFVETADSNVGVKLL